MPLREVTLGFRFAPAESGQGDGIFIVPTEHHRLQRIQEGSQDNGVFTFPQLLFAINEPMDRLPESHQRMLLDHVINELAKKKKLKALGNVVHLPGFRRALFAELSELSGAGVSSDDFAAAIRQISSRPRPKDIDIALIFTEYRGLLERQNWHDRASEYADALCHFERAFQKQFGNCELVCIEGFTQFTPLQIEILKRLRQANVPLQITLPDDEAGAREELFRVSSNTASSIADVFPERSEQQVKTVHRPAGLLHVSENLFRNEVKPSKSADGLQILEAPGLVGEVKMVVRAIKSLLLQGTKPDDVVISSRDLSAYADLLEEFCSEYGIPIEMEGTTPLNRNPAVAALLKAARLPDDNFRFADTGALLRNSFLQPRWPEYEADPEIALDTELLLRLLGEPRGTSAFLEAATKQAKNLDPPLEDESAAGSDRRYRQKLAERCLPFLTRFLSAWDSLPIEAPLDDFVKWLTDFSDDLGFTGSASEQDADALTLFFDELTSWWRRQNQLTKKPTPMKRDEFWSIVDSIAASNGVPRTSAGPGRVRIVPAELAVGLKYQHLFLMGLSEGSFPNLGVGPRIYDEQERREFRGVGIELNVSEERRPAEMLLFFRLLSGADRSVTLSYPAIDEQGQSLLPATFLSDVKSLFVEGAIPTTRRQMLIEGLDIDDPLSPTEYRWHFAEVGGKAGPLSDGLIEHLAAAKLMAQQRFSTDEHNYYDGMLSAKPILKSVDEQFGARATFSATALENYVACPFKYFVGNALGLRALPEPGEEIEARMRGAAYHRAVARLHKMHTQPGETTSLDLAKELHFAIDEYARRAGSPITKALWQLENDRMSRHAQRYGGHWTTFRDKCGQAETEVTEVDFGPGSDNEALIIRADNLEIRIIGRIDRIDVVEHETGNGFWIIDYKTGKSGNYTGKAIDRYEALQLPLYALAAQRCLTDFQSMQPLGIAYWFPTSGHKVAKRWAKTNEWQSLRDRLEQVLTEVVRHIRTGEFPLHPADLEGCTATCDFSQMCRITQSRSIEKKWSLTLPIVDADRDE